MEWEIRNCDTKIGDNLKNGMHSSKTKAWGGKVDPVKPYTL
jgi:hypothetical protein